MNEEAREAWRKALTAKAAASRRQRYPAKRKILLNVRGIGMVRVPAPRDNGGHDHQRQVPG